MKVNQKEWYSPIAELSRLGSGYQFNLRAVVQGIFAEEIERKLAPERRRGDLEVRVNLAGVRLELEDHTARCHLKLDAEYRVEGHSDHFRREAYEETRSSFFDGRTVPDAVVECVRQAAQEFAATLPDLPELGFERSRTEGAPLSPFTGQRHAVIVGISLYHDQNFSTLPRARSDAEALAEFLKSPLGGNIAEDRVQVLTDKKATRSNIIAALVRAGRESQPGDLVLVYFGCHGLAPSGDPAARYLVPFDGNMNQPEATALAKAEVSNHLDGAEAERQLVFLDCCFAGPLTRGDVEDGAFDDLVGRGRVVLTSTKGSERALDAVGTLQHSPFAASILKVLRGQTPGADADEDGRLSAQEIYDAIRPEVISSASQVGHRMTPQLYGDREVATELEVTRIRQRP